MKKLLYTFLFVFVVTGVSQTAFAQQCDRSRLSPIKCGYYEEGYQDGANDARTNVSNDYRRFRSKLDSQYESFYQTGYDEGYASVRPYSRWDDRQKNSYDQGYDDGKSDRNRNISRLPARYEGQYDRNYEEYFRKGYLDGYDNRPKQYDTPIGGTTSTTPIPQTNPNFPNLPGRNRGTATGTATWNGIVDNRVDIVIKGNEIRSVSVAGPLTNNYQTIQGVLPRRDAILTLNKLDGRGSAWVRQQPTRSNDFTGIIQVYDSKRGADNYNLQIAWTSTQKEEPYTSGRIVWRGRVDGTAAIRINGDFVETTDETGSGLTQVTFSTQGYLAARNGTVRYLKKKGRGSIQIAEQPSEQNDYTAVIRVFDPERSDDLYEVEIEW